jgi:uncharacterized LabA/DUF88 family protein
VERVISFIDGFNMYHSLLDAGLNGCKWLNYFDLSKAFCKKSQELVGVYYFSALAPWDTDKSDRHKIYIRALRFAGIEVVLGKFKTVTRNCRSCRQQFKTFEEKETDVNIAVHMVKLAMLDSFDTALLFSGDSDMLPAIKTVKSVSPHKNIHVVVPYGRSAVDLKNHCDESSKIKLHHLQRNQFPDPIVVDAGKGITISKPSGWV